MLDKIKTAEVFSLVTAEEEWSDCESVELEGADEIAGVYTRAGAMKQSTE